VERPGDDAAAREIRVTRLIKRCGYASLAYWDRDRDLKEWRGLFLIRATGDDHGRSEALFPRLRVGGASEWIVN
jgi:hypothetical protein